MTKRPILIVVLIAITFMALGAIYIMRPTAEASGPIQAITLVAEQEAESDNEPTAVSGTQKANTGTDSRLIFEISQDNSQVSFELDEDLRGVRTTVLGSTDQVAGQISLDPSDLSTVQVGTIQVNARTLTTDNDFRNRAIQNEILDSGSYEYITFTPTAVTGLPDSTGLNDTVSFTIVGDLTIRDTTQQVAFEVTATLVSQTELRGTASVTISRQDFGLTIPSVPQVANVEDEVNLEIIFSANS